MGAGLRSGGDLGGFRPGEPRWGGLVEGLGEDSGPAENTFAKILLYNLWVNLKECIKNLQKQYVT